jgi:hypothetical protein
MVKNLHQDFKGSLYLYFIVMLLTSGAMSTFAQSIAYVQIIHAAKIGADESLDVYLNGQLANSALSFKTGTSFLGVPSNQNLRITVVTSGSGSEADSLASIVFAPQKDQSYILTFANNNQSSGKPYDFVLDTNALRQSPDANKAAFKFVHADQQSPAFDIVLRDGPMIVGNLGFLKFTPYILNNPEEVYLDIKKAGTTDLLSTYRLSLLPEKGKAMSIVMIPAVFPNNPSILFMVYEDGFSIPIDPAPVARAQYINALLDTVDVYKNGTRFSDNTLPGGAMPYKYLPAGISLSIAISPYKSMNALNPYGKNSYTFDNMRTYTAISAGDRLDAQYPVQMFIHEGALEKSIDTTKVSVLFFQGSHYWPKVDVRLADGSDLFSSVSYGDYKGYQHFSSNENIRLKIYVSGTSTLLAEYKPLDLSVFRGKSITLFTKMSGASAHPELWVAQSNGTSKIVSSALSSAFSPVLGREAVVLYPSIASNVINVVYNGLMPPLTYEVIDIGGNKLLTGMIREEETVVSLDQIRDGAYFLRLSNQNFICTKPFMVIRR